MTCLDRLWAPHRLSVGAVLLGLALLAGEVLFACSDTASGRTTDGPTDTDDLDSGLDGTDGDAGDGGDGAGDSGDGGDGGVDLDDRSDSADTSDLDDRSDTADSGDGGADDSGQGDAGFDVPGDDAGGTDLIDAGPTHAFCELGLHSLAQLADGRCLTLPEGVVLRSGEHLIVARAATPAEFASCYPEYPAVVDTGFGGGGAYFTDQGSGQHYIDASAAVFDVAGGLPLIDGGETYELRIGPCAGGLGFAGSGVGATGQGLLLEATTDVPTDELYHLERRVPIDAAASDAAWDIVQDGGRLTSPEPNPGRFVAFVYTDLVFSEISHADTAGCSFVEITCPYTETVPPPQPECCDVESNLCLDVTGPSECDGIYYPAGGCVEPCDQSPPPPPDPACCFFETGACGSVSDAASCEGIGLFYPFAAACVEPCTAIDPPPLVGQCCDYGLDSCVDLVFGDACNGTFYPAGGPACSEPCPRTTPPGACCLFEAETCVDDVLEGWCNGQGAFFALASCDSIECGGGCCQTDGACTDDARNECDGRFLGAGAVCDPNPCRGACCDSDGTCAARTEESCSLRHGEFIGYNVACMLDLCVGACCNRITGECRQVVADACVSGGDTWFGAGTSCGAVACSATDGGCCLATGACGGATLAECVETDGTWLGVDSVCEDGSCNGACCNLVTGECAEVTEPECAGPGAVWHGVGSACDTIDPCTSTQGGCCASSGTCALGTSAECGDGTYFAGDFCGGGLCLGACCNRATGECTEGFAQDDCVGTGLTWGGYGSTCADVVCQPDQDLDGVIDDDDNCLAIANNDQSSLDGADGLGDVCDPTPFVCPLFEGGTAVTGFSTLVTTDNCSTEVQRLLEEVSQTCTTTCVWGLFSSTAFADDNGVVQNTYVCCSTAFASFACEDCPGADPMCPDPDLICPANNPF